MLLARRVDTGQSHCTPQRDRQHGQHHEGGEKAPHEVETAEQVADPFGRQRHDQVVAEQAVAEGVGENQDRRVARDARCILGASDRFTTGHFADIGRDVVPHKTPGEPGQDGEDRAVAHEKPLRREPPADLGPRLVNPRKNVVAADDQPDEQKDRDRRKRGAGLGKTNDDAGPMSLRQFLGGGEDDHALSQACPEHEVDMIRPPRALGVAAEHSHHQHDAAEDCGHGTKQCEPADRGLTRFLNEIRPAGDRSAHRLPPRALSCRLRT